MHVALWCSCAFILGLSSQWKIAISSCCKELVCQNFTVWALSFHSFQGIHTPRAESLEAFFYSLSVPWLQCCPGRQVPFSCPEGRRPLYVCTSCVQIQRGNARSGLDMFLSFRHVICSCCIGTALKACLGMQTWVSRESCCFHLCVWMWFQV